MRRITAAITTAFGQPLTLAPALLRPPGPGEVEIETDAVAICHSDLLFIAGDWGGPLPAVFGHEAAGRVTMVGPGVQALGQSIIGTRMGDSVIARDIPAYVDLWRQGRLKLAELVSARLPFSRINDALAQARGSEARRIVMLLQRSA